MNANDSPEIDTASVVMLGSFNPAIFQPAWFKAYDLLSGPEADEAEIKLIHPQFTEFSTDWLQVAITRERFKVQTMSQAHFEHIRDLAVGVFHLLEHTPITAMGINRDMHFRIDSQEHWHALGDNLAPKEIWVSMLRGIGDRDRPGLRSMTIEGYSMEPNPHSVVNVRVEPSLAIQPGLFLGFNRHFKFEDCGHTLRELLQELESNWSKSLVFGLDIAKKILEHA